MCKLILTAISIALMAGVMALATPAQAQQRLSWCSRIQGHLHCAFHSRAQCRAAVSGRQGTCVRNPR
jgi:Protein of unknown function (DUF3551)